MRLSDMHARARHASTPVNSSFHSAQSIAFYLDWQVNRRHPQMKPQAQVAITRTIRRHELRAIVPLADTTIYDMEQRGEFPRRFYLTSRCVVWDLAEVEAWLEERRRASRAKAVKRAPIPDVQLRKTRPIKHSVRA